MCLEIMNKRSPDCCLDGIWWEVFKFAAIHDISSLLSLMSGFIDSHSASDQTWCRCAVVRSVLYSKSFLQCRSHSLRSRSYTSRQSFNSLLVSYHMLKYAGYYDLFATDKLLMPRARSYDLWTKLSRNNAANNAYLYASKSTNRQTSWLKSWFELRTMHEICSWLRSIILDSFLQHWLNSVRANSHWDGGHFLL